MTFARNGTSYEFDVLQGSVETRDAPLRTTVQVASDGEVVGSPPVLYETFVVMTLRLHTSTEWTNLKAFVLTTCGIKGSAFTLTPDVGYDVGGGIDAAVQARFWSDLVAPVVFNGIRYVDLEMRKEVP